MPYNTSLPRRAIAEVLGTCALIFFGCGAIAIHSTAIPLIWGLIVMVLVYTFGHISGAHLNPAVTFAFAITRHFPFRELVAYVLAQVIGALLGIALLTILFPDAATYGNTIPHIPLFSAFIFEVVMTFFLMFVVMSVATDTRAVGFMAGIAIGAIVTLDAYIGGPSTGTSLNPARTLAPAIFEGHLEYLWLYTLAPVLGASLGAVSYKLIGRSEEVKK